MPCNYLPARVQIRPAVQHSLARRQKRLPAFPAKSGLSGRRRRPRPVGDQTVSARRVRTSKAHLK